jgi:hypothetical protein
MNLKDFFAYTPFHLANHTRSESKSASTSTRQRLTDFRPHVSSQTSRKLRHKQLLHLNSAYEKQCTKLHYQYIFLDVHGGYWCSPKSILQLLLPYKLK